MGGVILSLVTLKMSRGIGQATQSGYSHDKTTEDRLTWQDCEVTKVVRYVQLIPISLYKRRPDLVLSRPESTPHDC